MRIKTMTLLLLIMGYSCSSEKPKEVSLLESEQKNTVPYYACLHSGLSDSFYHVLTYWPEKNGKSILEITVYDEETKDTLDDMKIETGLILSPVYADCDSHRSFTTGKNLDQEIVDNYPGDLVVADFNFDNLEDFAVVCEVRKNGDRIYRYYLQDDNRKFHRNEFLSYYAEYFPNKIDSENRTISTQVQTSTHAQDLVTYHLDQDNKWTRVNSDK